MTFQYTPDNVEHIKKFVEGFKKTLGNIKNIKLNWTKLDEHPHQLLEDLDNILSAFFLNCPSTPTTKGQTLFIYANLIIDTATSRYSLSTPQANSLTMHVKNLVRLSRVYFHYFGNIPQLDTQIKTPEFNHQLINVSQQQQFIFVKDHDYGYEINDAIQYLEAVYSALSAKLNIEIRNNGKEYFEVKPEDEFLLLQFKLMHYTLCIKDTLKQTTDIKSLEQYLFGHIEEIQKLASKSLVRTQRPINKYKNRSFQPEPTLDNSTSDTSSVVVSEPHQPIMPTEKEELKIITSSAADNPISENTDGSPPQTEIKEGSSPLDNPNTLPEQLVPSGVSEAIQKIEDYIHFLENDSRDHVDFGYDFKVKNKPTALKQFIDGFKQALNNDSGNGASIYLQKFYNKELILEEDNKLPLYDILNKGQNITTFILGFFNLKNTTTLNLIDNLYHEMEKFTKTQPRL